MLVFFIYSTNVSDCLMDQLVFPKTFGMNVQNQTKKSSFEEDSKQSSKHNMYLSQMAYLKMMSFSKK